MAFLRGLFFAGIGALLLVALLPQTNWIVRNHADLIRGNFPPDNFMRKRGSMYSLGNPMIQALDQDHSEADEFALATLETVGVLNPDNRRPFAERLIAYCKSHPKDAAGWGTLCRHLCLRALRETAQERQSRGEKAFEPRYYVEQSRYLADLRWATQSGMSADPKNAFFPSLLSTLLPLTGEISEAKRLLATAAKCQRYDDYVLTEPQAITKLVRDRKGFRGYAFEATVYGQTLFAHLDRLRKRLPALVWSEGSCDHAAQANLIRCSRLMLQGSTSRIEMYMAQGLFVNALFRPQTAEAYFSKKAPTMAALTDAIKVNLSGEQAQEALDTARPFDLFAKRDAEFAFPHEEAENIFNREAYVRPTLPIVTVSLLVALLPGACLMMLISRVKLLIPGILKLGPVTRKWLAAMVGILGILAIAMIACQLLMGGTGREMEIGYPGLALLIFAALFMPGAKTRFYSLAAPIMLVATSVYLVEVATELRSNEVMQGMIQKMHSEGKDIRASIGLTSPG